MTPLQQLLFDAINEIQDIKRSSSKVPDLATMEEVFNNLKPKMIESLRALCLEKKLKYHKNVNGIVMFGIND